MVSNVVSVRSVFRTSLLIGILCGCASVLLDLDHIPNYPNFTQGSRPAHLPALIIYVIGISCIGGYICWLILSRNRIKS